MHCRVIISELVTYTCYGEIPDVIGWVNNMSILVECKTHRADFRRDKTKIFRQVPKYGIGHWKFYLSLPGIIPHKELPMCWGLYELENNRVVHKYGWKYSNGKQPPFDSQRSSEVALLVSKLARTERKSK